MSVFFVGHKDTDSKGRIQDTFLASENYKKAPKTGKLPFHKILYMPGNLNAINPCTPTYT